jgi:iron complex outermembrane receptor protein
MDKERFAGGVLVLVCSALVTPVFAQGAVEEIVVTARKRAESLQEVPVSISVFDTEALNRHHISDLKSVADYTAGLVFDQGFVQQDTRPQIRGLPATRGRPPVGILLDGIDVSSESMVTAGGGMLANLQLIDAERIEVVKGPQSALYGRVAFGGAINYVTKQPGDSLEGSIGADVGAYGQREFKAAVGGPLADNFGVRLSVMHSQHDGFYNDSVSGTDLGTSESTGFSLAGRLTLSDNLEIRSRVMYSDSEWSPRPQYALLSATGQSVPLPLPANAAGLLLAGAAFPLPATAFVPPPGDLGQLGQVQLSLDPRTGQPHKGATLDSFIFHTMVDWQVSDNIMLSSWTGITDASGSMDQDTDFYGLPWTFITQPAPGGVNEPLNVFNQAAMRIKTDQISQEFRLSNLDNDGLRWAVGYQYWREDVSQQNQNAITVLFGVPGFEGSAGLNLAQQGLPGPVAEWRDTEHQSIYALLEYDFTDRLTGSIEARASDEDVDQGWLVGGIGAFGFVAPFGPGAPLNVGFTDTATSSDSFFTPRATLEFQATDNTLYYGTISKGAKPGGVSSIFGTNSETGRFFPETLWNYEAGLKTTFADGRVQLNASAFYMDYTDRQITSLEPSNLVVTGFALAVKNAAEAEVTGLELEATWNVTDDWTLFGSYAFLKSEYTDFRTNTTGGLGVALAGNCTVVTVAPGTEACSTDFSGNALERIPENSFVVSSLFRKQIGGDKEFGFDLTVRYQDERSNGGDGLHLFPSFTILDAQVGIQTDTWGAFFYADNVLDDDTVQSGQGYGDLQRLGNLAITTFAPDKRQVGVRINYNFGR